MKKLLLLTVFCLAALAGRSQTIVINADNTLGTCDVITTYHILDPFTCAVVSSSSTSYTIPVGTSPSFTPTWVPSLGAGILVADVSYVSCPGSTVRVGPGGPCGFGTTMSMPVPPGCSCGPDKVDFPSPVIGPPGPPTIYVPLSVHP